ncbi:uncharacterized protein [Rutidosis leptorrhynchoides]
MAAKVVKMLHIRELCGNSITCNKKKVNFQEQYQKIQISKPTIWKFYETAGLFDAALEHVYVDILTQDGVTKSEILLTGGVDRTFCFYEVGRFGLRQIPALRRTPDLLQTPDIEKQTALLKSPGMLSGPTSAFVRMHSNVSCVKIPGNYYPQATDVNSSVSHALITTLGSEASGGSVFMMNLSEPLDYSSGFEMMSEKIDNISRFKSTVWTADINSDGSRAVIGTNVGVALVHIESGRKTWICHSKSDVLSLQFDCSGNIVLCGLRNGAIVTIDARQKPDSLLPRHQIPFPSLKTSESVCGRGQKRDKRLFEIKGNVYQSRTVFMPSSVSCLAALKLYDQYFLASSMDGMVRLYDHRLTQRGPVQFYEGNVNSHTRIQFGVDPSERYFMSGGEDFCLRLWNIKSGEILYEDKFMTSVPSVVCWARGSRERNTRPGNHLPGAWVASREELFYVNIS